MIERKVIFVKKNISGSIGTRTVEYIYILENISNMKDLDIHKYYLSHKTSSFSNGLLEDENVFVHPHNKIEYYNNMYYPSYLILYTNNPFINIKNDNTQTISWDELKEKLKYKYGNIISLNNIINTYLHPTQDYIEKSISSYQKMSTKILEKHILEKHEKHCLEFRNTQFGEYRTKSLSKINSLVWYAILLEFTTLEI